MPVALLALVFTVAVPMRVLLLMLDLDVAAGADMRAFVAARVDDAAAGQARNNEQAEDVKNMFHVQPSR